IDVAAVCLARVETPVGLADHVDVRVGPRRLGRVTLGQDLDGLGGITDEVLADLEISLEGAENGVVLEQVRERLGVGEVVDRDDFDVAATSGDRAPEIAADPTEAVDAYTDGHGIKLLTYRTSLSTHALAW